MLCFNGKDNYIYDPVRNLNFDRYKLSNKVRVSWGIDSLKCNYEKGYKNISIYFEEPNFLLFHEVDHLSENYDVKLTLCKYSSNEFNKKNSNKKSYNVFFPIDTILLKEKIFDKYDYNLGTQIPTWKNINVLYTGNDNFNIVYYFKHIMNNYNEKKIEIPTYLSKMETYLHSKIAIVHNILLCTEGDETIWDKVPVFKGNYIIPQLKSRVFEAACSQCIILCLKDNYNIIEDWFTPEEDFLYFSSKNELENLIVEILNNYEKYAFLGFNAYNKFMNNYTLQHFCDNYINIYS
jgi:glycosyltransferase involved in cell wall biosynthesis